MTQIDEDGQERSGPRFRLVSAIWAMTAAFGVYFCMYGFRKPFTAAAFAEGTVWGIGEKTVLVTAQVLGYTLSKIVGIRLVAEMPPSRRALAILVLVGAAELALLGFAVAPAPLHVVCLFLNGLPLGMVFGMVLGFLEGRRVTEALTAGLCTSFILADGLTKSAGTWLLDQGVSERWMPALAGMMFVPPLLLFVGMLRRIPAPDRHDLALRGERIPMDRQRRGELVRRYGLGLAALVAVYLLITIARSIRADFAPELWRGLGVTVAPETFARSESLVALGVLVANGLSILIVDNRLAFFTALGVALLGALIMVLALAGLHGAWMGGFSFMVLMGLGLYLPYVAVHTTIFERLIAMTQERGNLGFLMYIADSVGYLGYAALMVGRAFFPHGSDFVAFYARASWLVAVLSCAGLAATWLSFRREGTGYRVARTGG